MQYWQRKVEQSGFSNVLNNVNDLLLPTSGLLGSTLIKISGSAVSGLGANGGAWRLIDFLSKVEVIVNGSVICKSFDGFTGQGVATFDQGVTPPADWRNYATNTMYDWVLINYGRFFKDPTYQLDLSKYDNVHLKITNNATSASLGDFTTEIVNFYLKDKKGGQVSPGYMRTEEWRIWTTIADNWQYLKLPVEYPIRRILLRATPSVDANNIESANMKDLMDRVQLYFKTGDLTVQDQGIEDIMRENYLEVGKSFSQFGSEYMNAGKGVRIDLGYVLGEAHGAGTQAGTAATTVPTFDSARSSFTQVPQTFQADHPTDFVAHGLAPFETVVLPFDTSPDPADWLDPNAYGEVDLNVHTRNSSGAASGINKVILDRFVKY